ncbi:hypothetical protein G15_0017 [Enterococcus avium]|uniref:hypothetical protein n=1 Tax=Enterococcus malodoratus TaxID=71451 RepID=UPI00159AACE3|nr:hypothetical protein [Enterococcus malodoratus]BBM16415.1 hypothetical protein G15_0017 [Enterococcus avium]
MNIEELQLTLGKDLATQMLVSFSKTNEYKKIIGSEMSFHEQKTILVLEIYDRVQRQQLNKKIAQLSVNSKIELLKQLLSVLKDVQTFETNLYTMKRLKTGDEILETILSGYYGMVPDEKINLLEAIEEIVETNVFSTTTNE